MLSLGSLFSRADQVGHFYWHHIYSLTIELTYYGHSWWIVVNVNVSLLDDIWKPSYPAILYRQSDKYSYSAPLAPIQWIETIICWNRQMRGEVDLILVSAARWANLSWRLPKYVALVTKYWPMFLRPGYYANKSDSWVFVTSFEVKEYSAGGSQ